jgi:hypothetical protein
MADAAHHKVAKGGKAMLQSSAFSDPGDLMTRSLRNIVFLALTGIVAAPLAMAPVESAEATSLAPLTLDQMTDASVAIVHGKVTRIWTEASAEGWIWTRAEVQITEVIKGVDLGDSIVVDVPGGMLGDELTNVEKMARFDIDEDVVLFLDQIRQGTRWTTVGGFTGKYTLRRPADEDRLVAIQFTLPTEEVYDARFLPVPAKSARFYADDLMARIQTHLDAGWDGKAIPGASLTDLQIRNTAERRHR